MTYDSRQGRHWRDHVRPAVLRRDGYRCRLRRKGCTGVATEADHVIPKARGGPDTLDNAVAACAHCNRSKGAGRRLAGSVFNARLAIPTPLDKISLPNPRTTPLRGDYSRKPAESAYGPRRAAKRRQGLLRP